MPFAKTSSNSRAACDKWSASNGNTIAIEFVIYRIDPAAMESYAHHEREVIEVARACHCAKTGNPNNPNQEGLMNPFEV
jgi:hypothetical protein